MIHVLLVVIRSTSMWAGYTFLCWGHELRTNVLLKLGRGLGGVAVRVLASNL